MTRGLQPPDPRFLYPLSSTEFVEPPPPEQNSWVRHCNSELTATLPLKQYDVSRSQHGYKSLNLLI